jgi:acetyl-CoA C-acetyltransferase
VAQITDLATPPLSARSPINLMAEVSRKAAGALARRADSILVSRLFSDSTPRFKSDFGRVANPPWSVAQRIGATPGELVYLPGGGNMPQVALNRACERIARGESQVAILTGAEAQRTELAARRAGVKLDWSEDAPCEPEEWGGHRYGFSEHEALHGMRAALNMYALFENAIRGSRGIAMDLHARSMGRLFARFAAVAARNPLATRGAPRTAEEIATISEQNPIIVFPYTKLMASNAYVDQAAAVVVCSEAMADEAGVPLRDRVYLNGCAEANDHWYVTERADLHSSPALRRVAPKALEMAEITLSDCAAFDLYSCFPSAVEIACQELGLAEDDPREFTVTGGLPYFGGPGNNYVMHSIAAMVEWARAHPGQFGLLTANGNYVTKHAVGVYSTTAPAREWSRKEPAILQREIDALPKAPFTETPEGPATVESYAVAHSKSGPELGIIVGRLIANDVRFIANTPGDRATLEDLERRDALGRRGVVSSASGRNLFVVT